MTVDHMNFREFKIGFYTPMGVRQQDRLTPGLEKIAARFAEDNVKRWFTPKRLDITRLSREWHEIAKEEADKLLTEALKAGMPRVSCGEPTFRLPYHGAPTDSDVHLIRSSIESMIRPVINPQLAKATSSLGLAVDAQDTDAAIAKALTTIFLEREGNPRIHCELIDKVWVDTVEFLLLEDRDGGWQDWHVLDDQDDPVLFTASITYDCPDDT